MVDWNLVIVYWTDGSSDAGNTTLDVKSKLFNFAVATFVQKCNFVTKFTTMIQRIQTLYIFFSSILIGLLFALPFAEIAANDKFYLFNIQGIMHDGMVIESGLPIMLFVGIILIIHLVAIFLFKKRIRQMRLLVFAILLMLGLFGMFYFFTFYSFKGFEVSFKIAVVFPLIAIIFDYLAIRNIGKDEALIRSIDRIR